MTNKRIELFFDILAFFAALIYFVVLFLNIDYFKVPHGDIYQYIGDAKQYINLQFPSLIQLQPLTPILMAIIRPFFSDFAFPYFAAAKFLNIFAASGTLVFTYLIAKKNLGSKIAFLIALLCSIHPLTLINALDITTVGLYVFFAMGALYFIDSNKKMFFIFTSLAFLVRIEGFVLFIIYLINQFSLQKIKEEVEKKNYKKLIVDIFKKNIYSIFFIIFALALTALQTIHNLNENSAPYGNQYINEVFSMPLIVESFGYIYGLFGVSFFPESFTWLGINPSNLNFMNVFLIFMSLSILLLGSFFEKTKKYGLYLLIMSIIHSFFPGMEHRYFFLFLNLISINTLIIFYEICQKNKSIISRIIFKLAIVITVIYWISFSINQVQNNFKNYREKGLDLYYETSSWLFDSMEKGNYYIFTEKEYLYSDIFLHSRKYLDSLKTAQPIITRIDGRTTKISINDKTLNFVRLQSIIEQCNNKKCLFELLQPEENAKYLLITHQWSSNQEKNYWWQINGLLFIDDMIIKNHCLSEKMSFKSGEEAYRKIYLLDKNCYLE